MIPLLTINAVKIKTGFDTACMTGNYECAYALGLLSAAVGMNKEDNITDLIELHMKVLDKLKDYEPANDAMKRLVQMLKEYEPTDKIDEQMLELYYVGFDNKSL